MLPVGHLESGEPPFLRFFHQQHHHHHHYCHYHHHHHHHHHHHLHHFFTRDCLSCWCQRACAHSSSPSSSGATRTPGSTSSTRANMSRLRTRYEKTCHGGGNDDIFRTHTCRSPRLTVEGGVALWELQSIKGANLKYEHSAVDCPHLPACQVAKHPHPSADPTLPRDPEWAQPARAHHAQEWHDADGRPNGRDADGWRPQRDEHGAEAAAWTSHTACRSRVGTAFVELSVIVKLIWFSSATLSPPH